MAVPGGAASGGFHLGERPALLGSPDFFQLIARDLGEDVGHTFVLVPPVRDGNQTVERALCSAAVDRAGGDLDTLSQVARFAADDECRCGVEQDDVTERPWLAGQHFPDGRGIHLGVSAFEVGKLGGRQAGVGRRDLEHLDLAVLELGHVVAPVVVSSSRPSWPWTTQTCSEPRFFSTWAIGSTQWLGEDADDLPLDAGGVARSARAG